jgi:hypothetical protein
VLRDASAIDGYSFRVPSNHSKITEIENFFLLNSRDAFFIFSKTSQVKDFLLELIFFLVSNDNFLSL